MRGLWWNIGRILMKNQTAFSRGLWLAWENNCWSYVSSREDEGSSRRMGREHESTPWLPTGHGGSQVLLLNCFPWGSSGKSNPHLPGKEYGNQEGKVMALILLRWFHVGEFYDWKKIMDFWILKRQLGYGFSVKKAQWEMCWQSSRNKSQSSLSMNTTHPHFPGHL